MTNQNDKSNVTLEGSISCQQLDSFIVDYIDGKLTEEQRIVFDNHLSDCPSCMDYVEAYKSAILLGKNAYDKDIDECDENIPDKLVTAILKASRKR